MTDSLRSALTLVAALLVTAALGVEGSRFVSEANLRIPVDYNAFHSVGTFARTGRNPYDVEGLKKEQEENGFQHPDGRTIPVFHPPWMLPPLMVLSAFPLGSGYALFTLVSLAALLVCGDGLWRLYGGQESLRFLGWFIALTFAPSVALLGTGQLSGWSLLGVLLFLKCVKANRPVLAGLATALIAVKPHLHFLFGLVLFLEMRRSAFARKAVLWGGLVGLILSLIPIAFRPTIWFDFLTCVTSPGSEAHQGLADWSTPLLGGFLRELVPGRPGFVQALPCLVCTFVYLLGYYTRTSAWDWLQEMPQMMTFSLVCALYGGWVFDLVLLLVPIFAQAQTMRRRRFLSLDLVLLLVPIFALRILTRRFLWLLTLLAINIGGYLSMMLHAPQSSYVWMSFTVLWLGLQDTEKNRKSIHHSPQQEA